MTERLYYADSTLLRFEAQVVFRDGDGTRVVLDRSAFYPTGGGQPHDTGTLGGVRVIDVIDEDTRVVHVLEHALPIDESEQRVVGEIDHERRRDHTQQHSAQHLLSAILHDVYARPTLSFHLGPELSTIDLGGAPLTAEQLEEIERRVFDAITEDRAVRADVHDAAVEGLRKASERSGPTRVVTIDGLDVNACGGTHVRSTGELGLVRLLGVEKVRAQTRLSFVAGHRALARTRSDATLVARLAQEFRTAPAQAIDAAIRQRAQLADAEKALSAAQRELGRLDGAAQYAATTPDARGRRLWKLAQAEESSERTRSAAETFASGASAIALITSESARSVLLVASPDSGVDAGALLKPILAAEGGRGGGSASRAQGSVPDVESLERVVAALLAQLRAS